MDAAIADNRQSVRVTKADDSYRVSLDGVEGDGPHRSQLEETVEKLRAATQATNEEGSEKPTANDDDDTPSLPELPVIETSGHTPLYPALSSGEMVGRNRTYVGLKERRRRDRVTVVHRRNRPYAGLKGA
jgi:hypothetical protein